jgi:hypothetical protein
MMDYETQWNSIKVETKFEHFLYLINLSNASNTSLRYGETHSNMMMNNNTP